MQDENIWNREYFMKEVTDERQRTTRMFLEEQGARVNGEKLETQIGKIT